MSWLLKVLIWVNLTLFELISFLFAVVVINADSISVPYWSRRRRGRWRLSLSHPQVGDPPPLLAPALSLCLLTVMKQGRYPCDLGESFINAYKSMLCSWESHPVASVGTARSWWVRDLGTFPSWWVNPAWLGCGSVFPIPVLRRRSDLCRGDSAS